jgi:hypothetical protein
MSVEQTESTEKCKPAGKPTITNALFHTKSFS